MMGHDMKRYASLKSAGRCVVCEAQAVAGRTRCKVCLDKVASRMSARGARLQKANACYNCAKRRPARGRARCQECLDKQNRRGILKRKEQREAAIKARGGGCEICGCQEAELLVFHHYKFNGSEDRKDRTPARMIKDVIAGRDTNLILVDVACHARLHSGTAQLPASYQRRRR